MPQYTEYYAKDKSSDVPVRAYKTEDDATEVLTIGGSQVVGPGVYVVERDRPELNDIVPADVFEETYGEQEVSADEVDATPTDADLTSAEGEQFDPNAHTVAEVQAYLAEHPEDRDRVLAAESGGLNRATVK